jgi:hypothetical protein
MTELDQAKGFLGEELTQLPTTSLFFNQTARTRETLTVHILMNCKSAPSPMELVILCCNHFSLAAD